MYGDPNVAFVRSILWLGEIWIPNSLNALAKNASISFFLAKVREFILEVFWFLDFFGELQTNRKTQYANVATSKVGFFFAQVALSIILNLLNDNFDHLLCIGETAWLFVLVQKTSNHCQFTVSSLRERDSVFLFSYFFLFSYSSRFTAKCTITVQNILKNALLQCIIYDKMHRHGAVAEQ